MPRQSRRLVIDASVAQSAGGPGAVVSESARCREFLIAVLRVCHRVIFTASVREEWDRHQSLFARRWRVSMNARRKVAILIAPENANLRKRIAASAAGQREQQALMKDVHLIEAALAGDSIVVSRDEEIRDLFKLASDTVGELRAVAWVNPGADAERPVAWVEDGAIPERTRLLGWKGKT